MATLGQKLKEAREKAKKIRDVSDSVGDGGTPSDEQLGDVTTWLGNMETDLGVIHNPLMAPSLTPTSAGAEMEVTIPSSRLQTCEDALDLAEEAEAEEKKASPNYDYIGDRTRTLEAEYVPAIRTKFGITT